MSDIVEHGTVVSVSPEPVGSWLTTGSTAGDTVIVVDDNVNFSPGDQVYVAFEDDDGEFYTLGDVDDETTLTLTSPLTADAPEGTRVSVYPFQQQTVAMVRLTETGGEPAPCVVLHTLADALRPGIRDEATTETVLTVKVDDIRYVFDIVARQTIRDVSAALPGVKPSQPDAPVLSTLAYLDSMHQLRAQISATWTPVTTNEDLSDITDLDHYELQTKGATGDWQTYTSTPGDIVEAFIRDLAPGSAWSVRVRAVDTSKNVSEWSDSTSITAAVDNIGPSTPSRPTLTSRLGVITISWDGKNSVAGAMEDDLAYVEVHLSTTTGFTPSSSTKVDQFSRAGSVVWGPATFGTTYYVKFVAADTSGNVSSASLQQSTDVKALVDVSNFPDDAMEVLYARTGHFITIDADQISGNSAAIAFIETGLIQGGIFETTSGGEFRTSATPSSTGGIRIRGTDGMKAWNSSGVQKFSVDPSTGLMTAVDGSFSGTISGATTVSSGGSIYAGVSGGARVALLGSTADLAFYDSSGTKVGALSGNDGYAGISTQGGSLKAGDVYFGHLSGGTPTGTADIYSAHTNVYGQLYLGLGMASDIDMNGNDLVAVGSITPSGGAVTISGQLNMSGAGISFGGNNANLGGGDVLNVDSLTFQTWGSVTRGATDSGGSGFRYLRVPN